MPTLISHLKLLVPVIDEPPPELVERFIQRYLRSATKTYRRLKEAMPDTKAVIEKMIKPSRKATQSLFRPDYVTRRGLKIKDIPGPDQADLEAWARRWLRKAQYSLEEAPEVFIQKIKLRAEDDARHLARSRLPFLGFGDKIRGVGPLGARWLTGDQSVSGHLGPADTIIQNGPVDITRPGQATRFRTRFINQILAAGSQIIKAHYRPSLLEKGNDKVNQLVTQYAAARFIPFTPGGASHVDFMTEARQLFLDIQVAIP